MLNFNSPAQDAFDNLAFDVAEEENTSFLDSVKRVFSRLKPNVQEDTVDEPDFIKDHF